MVDGEPGWRTVAALVRARIEEMGVSLREFERRAGVSDTTLRAVLRGRPLVRADKRAQLARGLGWTHDSIDRILRGEAPATAPDGAGAPAERSHLALLAKIERLSDNDRRYIEGLVDGLLRDR